YPTLSLPLQFGDVAARKQSQQSNPQNRIDTGQKISDKRSNQAYGQYQKNKVKDFIHIFT
ncbi:MAG: hypothetical protein ILA55_03550, partial [Erysipelotrichaceae bacterium]|nr:hypothetical protein [Erysipelotrichaceae bacterium]